MTNSIEKGKAGERELAKKFRAEGFPCERSQQYCGNAGDADLTGPPGIHAEVKRRERCSVYDFVAQAKAEAKDGNLPVVFYRANNSEWLAIMPVDESFMPLYKGYYEMKIYDEVNKNGI